VLSSPLGARGSPIEKTATICRLPSKYSFLRRTLMRACYCDCSEQSIGIYSLKPTNYYCTCSHAAVVCTCGRKIWVLYCAHKPSGRRLRPVPVLASKFPPETFSAGVCSRKIMSLRCVVDFIFDYRACCSGPPPADLKRVQQQMGELAPTNAPSTGCHYDSVVNEPNLS